MNEILNKLRWILIILFVGIIALIGIFTALSVHQTSPSASNIQVNTSRSKNTKPVTTTPIAADIVKNMGIGWNLGNTLESYSKDASDYENHKNSLQPSNISKEAYYETLSGNPLTTKAMIDKIKAAGFGAVRIPVTYYNHMDSQGNIDTAWLQRVATVVNYVLDDDMYCIIDMHHDAGAAGWLKADDSTFSTNSVKFKNAWKQIAAYFKEYSNKLLFEGYNEILSSSSNPWANVEASSYSTANKFDQLFVDTVRSTGGNNASRYLIVSTYAANAEDDAVNSFVLPKDTVSNSLIVDVHYYGTSQSGIDSVLNRLNSHFTNNGIPVIIGEFATKHTESESTRISVANYIITNAKKHNITCFWWDDGNYTNKTGAQCDYALLDRVSLNWYSPNLVQAIVNASKQ